MTESYESILNRQWGNIPDTKLLPSGHWRLRVRFGFFRPPASEDVGPSVVFRYEPVRALDDVDEDQLAELGSDYDLSNSMFDHRMFFENDRDLREIERHMSKHGVTLQGGISDKATYKPLRGMEIVAFVDKRSYTNKNGETITVNVAKNFQPVESK